MVHNDLHILDPSDTHYLTDQEYVSHIIQSEGYFYY
jgi:hypothetical protein